MLKRILAIAAFAAILIPTTSQAVDHSGQWAAGYYDDDAPLGLRYQFGEKAAFDFALGFDSFSGSDATGPGDKSFLTFNVEVGVPITMVKTDRADFFLRPGLLYSSVPFQLDADAGGPGVATDERASDVQFKLHLGAEWHVTDNFSLSAGHGINIDNNHNVSSGDLINGSKPESTTSWGTEPLAITQIGFHWYFGGE
jgi:hypothetical protein